MTTVLLLVIFAMCGLAFNLSQMYNRKAELQKAADVIAIAAAAKLNGTDAGISDAIDAAAKAASIFGYNYHSAVVWSPDALSFASSPYTSTWTDAASATGKAADLYFAKVDTARLDPSHGRVDLLFVPVKAAGQTYAQVNSRAIAGPLSTSVFPLAICAMSKTKGDTRGFELIEYGFRRGIGYDLMQLNPNDKDKGANFLVNPVAPSGTTGTSLALRMDVILPFICTGTLAIPPVRLPTASASGGKITVEPGFPLGSVWNQLNSRFGTYTNASPCTSANAPPDSNIKPYPYLTALTWMNDIPTKQSAEPRTTATALMTLPDLPQGTIPASTKPGMYGPLWLYAKPVPYSAFQPEKSEPESGYPTFGPADWPTLYAKGTPTLKAGKTYPSQTPYLALTQSPTGSLRTASVANRRVLNIPLLNCPVPDGSPATAEVLAIGKFFMTVPATDKELYAEFAGLAQPSSLGGQVKLYP
jgi:Flp pilus assembly protein TadG